MGHDKHKHGAQTGVCESVMISTHFVSLLIHRHHSSCVDVASKTSNLHQVCNLIWAENKWINYECLTSRLIASLWKESVHVLYSLPTSPEHCITFIMQPYTLDDCVMNQVILAHLSSLCCSVVAPCLHCGSFSGTTLTGVALLNV